MTDLVGNLAGKKLGQYEIIDIIGQGGMATVYKARQPSMDREVAVKVINVPLLNNPEFIARFETEARLIAHLQHAHILPVYDFGREGGILYLVMRLVDGGSLDQRLRNGALSLPEAAKMFSQIASALSYAHGEGVVHRDLKPNNILLDKSGIPYLTDFGIAKLLQNSVSLTATGTAMGTPSYMAPEQWRGSDIDARADIYALGIMLYEMLTGSLPFTGDTPYILMYKHFDERPPSIEQQIPGMPTGVNAIIQRALAKNPLERFGSATEMADALNTVVMGTGQAANIQNAATFVDKFQVAPTTIPIPSATAESPAPAQTAKPVPAESTAPRKRRWLIPAIAAVLILIVAIVGVVIFTAKNQPYRLLMELKGHHQPVRVAMWSPDGSRLASAGEDKTVLIWDVASGKVQYTLRGPDDVINSVAWSPDGTKIAAASNDYTIYLWNSTSGESLGTIPLGNLDSPTAVVWATDNKDLFIGFGLGKVMRWDTNAKKAVWNVKHSEDFWMPLALTSDGKYLAAPGKDTNIEVMDSGTGDTIQTISAHSEFLYAMAWNRDNTRLVTSSHDGTAHTWDMHLKDAVPLLLINASDSGVTSSLWSPDGNKLATSSGFTNLGGIDDYTIKIWDSMTGQLLATLEGHKGPVGMASWSPDGTKLASASGDGTVRIWATDK